MFIITERKLRAVIREEMQAAQQRLPAKQQPAKKSRWEGKQSKVLSLDLNKSVNLGKISDSHRISLYKIAREGGMNISIKKVGEQYFATRIA